MLYVIINHKTTTIVAYQVRRKVGVFFLRSMMVMVTVVVLSMMSMVTVVPTFGTPSFPV